MEELNIAPDAARPSAPLQDEIAPQPSGVRRTFFSADGLRSGWGVLLYVLMMIAIAAAGTWLAQSSGTGALRSQLVGEIVVLLAALVPARVMARIEKRRWGVYGLPLSQAFGKRFWQGAIWGFSGITLLLAALHGIHAFDFGHLALHGASILKFAAFWGLLFLLVGLFEEFLMRGYTQFTVARGIGFWPAAALLSCVFGLAHLGNKGEAWIGALAAGLIGLFFCLTLRRTGSLWFAVGFHAAWDWGESFFYSVPDSGQVSPGHLLSSSFHGSRWITGGTVGPEGSVMCFVVIALLWAAFGKVYQRVRA